MSTLRRGLALLAGLLVVAACQGGTAEIPAAVCVGEATTYFDWLNGDLLPDVPDEIVEPADPTGDLLEDIQEAGVLRIATEANYEPQSFRDPDGNWVGFDIDVGDGDRRGPGRRARVPAPGLGHHHRRQLGGALGRQRRFDDDHD